MINAFSGQALLGAYAEREGSAGTEVAKHES